MLCSCRIYKAKLAADKTNFDSKAWRVCLTDEMEVELSRCDDRTSQRDVPTSICARKIRAMQIISELEQTTRGPYAGCVGYFSFESLPENCEMCCGEEFWLWPRRRRRSIPAADCDD